jgi:hypothetical protein
VEEWDKPDVTYFECECGAIVYFNDSDGVEVAGEEAIKRWNRRALNL